MRPFPRALLRWILPGLRLAVGLNLIFALHGAFAQAPPASMDATLKTMLGAIQSGSLADFVAAGDASFKSKMTKEMLAGVSAQLGPRLNQGYTPTFFGTVNEQGYIVYIWKLEFKDGKDDRLVTMAVKDGKVGGFFLR